jgi:hypothetical protein
MFRKLAVSLISVKIRMRVVGAFEPRDVGDF